MSFRSTILVGRRIVDNKIPKFNAVQCCGDPKYILPCICDVPHCTCSLKCRKCPMPWVWSVLRKQTEDQKNNEKIINDGVEKFIHLP